MKGAKQGNAVFKSKLMPFDDISTHYVSMKYKFTVMDWILSLH